GAFIEGAAGFGAPVAIAGAFMIGLGFQPFHAAALNLIANTSPVAWGAIGTPVHTLAAVSGLPESDLSAMIGRILPITGLIVPFWLVRAMVGWSETIEVLPAILVVGTSFSLTQYLWSNHVDSNLVDIAGGVVSLIATVVFLRFWKPKRIWRFANEGAAVPAGRMSGNPAAPRTHTAGQILKAWLPFVGIWFMLGLGCTTRYSGLDAVLGLAFTRTGWLFPFFGTFLGWLGVALTGSDTSSNALFGSLQRITAQQLNLDPVLMCAAN